MKNYSTKKPTSRLDYYYDDPTYGATIHVIEDEEEILETGVLDQEGLMIYAYPVKYPIGFI